MASIKVKFRPSIVADHKGTIYYQIIHKRTVQQLLSAHHVFPAEWDDGRSMVTTTHNSERKAIVQSIRQQIRLDLERLTMIDRKLAANTLTYTASDVIEEFNRYARDYSLFNYMERITAHLKQSGKLRTSETYISALNSFRKFRHGEDLMLDALTSDIMEAYEAWLRQRGLVPNSISFYTRILRAVYNRAVEAEIIDDRKPFRKVYTGIAKTIKRALPLSIIKKIKDLELPLTSSLNLARDMFLMSFYLRGMSFIDMAYLKKTDLQHGYVTYRRRKTGQQLTIKWTMEMQTLLDKYPANASDYLLPIITTTNANARRAYRNASYNINHNLKTIATMVGITIPLTLYVARHSWASAAKANGIPLSVIAEGMGHDSETTTRIYLASLDTTPVDLANALILSHL